MPLIVTERERKNQGGAVDFAEFVALSAGEFLWGYRRYGEIASRAHSCET